MNKCRIGSRRLALWSINILLIRRDLYFIFLFYYPWLGSHSDLNNFWHKLRNSIILRNSFFKKKVNKHTIFNSYEYCFYRKVCSFSNKECATLAVVGFFSILVSLGSWHVWYQCGNCMLVISSVLANQKRMFLYVFFPRDLAKRYSDVYWMIEHTQWTNKMSMFLSSTLFKGLDYQNTSTDHEIK